MTSPERPAPPQLPLGLEGRFEKIVPREWTLASFDPTLPPVFSTPAMIGMMEGAAAGAVRPHLPPGFITVGTRIEVDHLKAVTTGARVIATARLIAQDRRFLTFEVEARSGDTIIGRGKVFRAIVHHESFESKASSRANS
ncbi:MAG: hotdog domain-containing protein [Candidatus Acidiferrales bacterium]